MLDSTSSNIRIQENISLKTWNTFAIDVKARYFVQVNSVLQLQQVCCLQGYPEILFLGGGSNMLLTKDLNKMVVSINMKGIRVVRENDNEVEVQVMAGENWDDLVHWALEQNYGGLENLISIPGKVGAAPIQNIGAYGVELKDVFVSCQVIEDFSSNNAKAEELTSLTKDDCQFGYRTSRFKKERRGRYAIVSINLVLSKHHHHRLVTSYGPIKTMIQEDCKKNRQEATIQDVARIVSRIRRNKLPDPKIIGNCGSFFQNVIVSNDIFQQRISSIHPDAPHYKLASASTQEEEEEEEEEERTTSSFVKVPTGWLIDRCGFKGIRYDNVGVHEHQALVLVNHGETTTGLEVLRLAHLIQNKVFERYGVEIVPEVNIY